MDAFLTSPPSAGSKRKSDTLSTAEKVPAATKVPSDLSQLSRDDLISMLKSVAAERDALTSSKKSAKKAASSSSSSSASASASSSSAAVDVAGIKKRLCAKAVKAIKKTKHNDKKKPYTEVTEGLASRAAAMQVMAGVPVKSDTSRMTKWSLTSDAAISRLLGCEKLIHPVAFDGKVWCFAGGPMPKVYAWAGFESLEVKFEPSSSLLTLKFRTFMAGSGDPSYNTQLSAYARGVGSLDGYDDDECDF